MTYRCFYMFVLFVSCILFDLFDLFVGAFTLFFNTLS